MSQRATQSLSKIAAELADELGDMPLTVEVEGKTNFVLVSEARYDYLVACAARLEELQTSPEDRAARSTELLAAFEKRDVAP